MKIRLWCEDSNLRETVAAALSGFPLESSGAFPPLSVFEADTLGIGWYANPDQARQDSSSIEAAQARGLGVLILTRSPWELLRESWVRPENRVYLAEPVPAEFLSELVHRAAFSFQQFQQNEAFANLFFLIWAIRIQTDYPDWDRVFHGILGAIAASYGGIRALLIMAEHGEDPPRVLASEGFPLRTEVLSESLSTWRRLDDPEEGPPLAEQWVRSVYRSMHYPYDDTTALYFPIVFRKRLEGYLYIECHYTENVVDLGRMITHFISDLIRIFHLESLAGNAE
ncbi:MAG: hypothetical protein ACM3QZ_01415 [Solirubrobacterales bacterium]